MSKEIERKEERKVEEEEKGEEGREKRGEEKSKEGSESEEKKEGKRSEEKEKKDESKIEKEIEKEIKRKRDFVIARAYDLPISTKKAVAICKAIKNLKLRNAIETLEDVKKLKKAIAMKGEIPHRKKGQRLSKHVQGRFPSKAAKYFIKVLNQAKANAIQLGFDEDKIYLSKIKADKGSTIYRPGRFFGRKFKRTHLYVEIRER